MDDPTGPVAVVIVTVTGPGDQSSPGGFAPREAPAMKDPDRKICYCYDVSWRKLVSFARRTRPVRASQMSECLGAGTGCGWCIPFLKKIQAAMAEGRGSEIGVSPDEYEAQRQKYIRARKRKNRF